MIKFRCIAWFALAYITVACSLGYAATTPNELLVKAQTINLAHDRAWLALGHYETHFGGYRSLADDAKFFLADNGTSDPAAELTATLLAFFQPTTAKKNDQHAQCRFPARLQMLQRTLGFSANDLPAVDCAKYRFWRTNFGNANAYLAFPSAAINNPAAMFGHTLLRFESTVGGANNPLGDFSVNYGADYNGETGLKYAWRGITGHYPGQFDILRYYLEARTYTDYRDRDIWEYRLKLSPQQIDMMLAHLWELQTIRFDYFFFDENCSYQLLTLLQVARPELAITDHFRHYTIPADTVRVLAHNDLLTPLRFRPSLSHQIEALSLNMSAADQQHALKLSATATDTDLANSSNDVTQLAYLHALRSVYRHDLSSAETAPKLHRLGAALAHKPLTGKQPEAKPTERPENGHATARWRLHAGSTAKQRFVEAEVRAAYHDLLDPSASYVDGAQIDFLSLAIRYQTAAKKVILQRAVIADIYSLSPWQFGLKPWSWHTAMRYQANSARWSGNATSANVGLGFTWKMLGGMPFILGNLIAVAAPNLDPNYTLQLGPQIGYLTNEWGAYRSLLTLDSSGAISGDDDSTAALAWQHRVALTKTTNLRATWTKDYRDKSTTDSGWITWEHYF